MSNIELNTTAKDLLSIRILHQPVKTTIFAFAIISYRL